PVVVEPAPVVNPFGDKRLVHTERIQEDRQYLTGWDGLGVGAAQTREQLARRIFIGHQVGELEGKRRLSDAALAVDRDDRRRRRIVEGQGLDEVGHQRRTPDEMPGRTGYLARH